MAKSGSTIKRYFSTTHSLLYSYLISLPLLILYEILIRVSQPGQDQIVRISVDMWIKTLFSYVDPNVLSITLILVALLGLFILYKERHRLSSLKLRYFLVMIFEASIYAFVLSVLISLTVGSLVQLIQNSPIESLSILQKMALSLGAGLYEELFFRVILVSALLWVFNYFFKKQGVAYTGAIIIAALLFSLAHYIGSMGDPFTLGSFLFRFLFGLSLNAIYIWRGFGMAAWTHAIYDLMVIVF